MDYSDGKFFETMLARIEQRLAYQEELLNRLIKVLAEGEEEEVKVKQAKKEQGNIRQG